MRIRKSSLNKIQTIALLLYWSCVAMNLFNQGFTPNTCHRIVHRFSKDHLRWIQIEIHCIVSSTLVRSIFVTNSIYGIRKFK